LHNAPCPKISAIMTLVFVDIKLTFSTLLLTKGLSSSVPALD